MLEIRVHMEEEVFDEDSNTFFFNEETDVVLVLVISLISLSKWESKHEKPFLSRTEKTNDETLDYIRTMIVTPDYPPEVFRHFSNDNLESINKYIDAKMTATWFPEERPSGAPNREAITAELIYYWIVSYQIPWDVEHWHLNRLFTLIKVFNAKADDGKKKKKMGTHEEAIRRQALNEQRRKQLGTTG